MIRFFRKHVRRKKENTLLHILSLRLRYPVSLTDEAKERYVAHLREQELYIIPKLVGQKNMERITFFCENGWITQAAVKAGLEQAPDGVGRGNGRTFAFAEKILYRTEKRTIFI